MFEKIKELMIGNMSKGNRKVYIDDLRVVATIFVIGVHTVSLAASMTEYGNIPFRVLTIFNFIFLSCNLLFVMLSGALLLPVKNEPVGVFFRKRFTKVAIPLVVYYILYIVAKEGIDWLRSLASDVTKDSDRCPGGGTSFLAGLCDHLAVCADSVYAVYCT